MSSTYDRNTWQQILECKAIGMTGNETAAECGVSNRYVSGFMQVMVAMRKKDFVSCRKLKKTYGFSQETFEWCAKKFDIEIPADAFKEPEKEKPKKELKEEPKPAQEIAQAKDYTLYFQKMLELQAQTNELLNQMMDAVIPKYVAEIKDNQNVNFDVISQVLKRQEDKMEAIKIGIRRKGM